MSFDTLNLVAASSETASLRPLREQDVISSTCGVSSLNETEELRKISRILTSMLVKFSFS